MTHLWRTLLLSAMASGCVGDVPPQPLPSTGGSEGGEDPEQTVPPHVPSRAPAARPTMPAPLGTADSPAPTAAPAPEPPEFTGDLEAAEAAYVLGSSDDNFYVVDPVSKQISASTRGAADAFEYDPVFSSMGAMLETRKSYGEDPGGGWRSTTLALPAAGKEVAFFAYPVPARHRISETPKRLFVVNNQTFSKLTESDGIREVVNILEKVYPDAGYVVLPGLYSPELLEVGASRPPLIGRAVAKDLYYRLSHYVATTYPDVAADLEVCLLGMGAGAGLSLLLLEEDARRPEADRLFVSGLALSPVVDLSVTVNALDSVPKTLKPADRKKHLTDLRNFVTFGPVLLDTAYWFALKTAADPKAEQLRWMFYNEFTVVFLSKLARLTYGESVFSWDWDLGVGEARGSWTPESKEVAGSSFRPFFEEFVYPQHAAAAGDDAETYARSVALFGHVKNIDVPVYLVLAEDDPVMVNSDDRIVDAVRSWADEDVQRRAFIPKRGGHGAYMADPKWIRAIVTAFFGGS